MASGGKDAAGSVIFEISEIRTIFLNPQNWSTKKLKSEQGNKKSPSLFFREQK